MMHLCVMTAVLYVTVNPRYLCIISYFLLTDDCGKVSAVMQHFLPGHESPLELRHHRAAACTVRKKLAGAGFI